MQADETAARRLDTGFATEVRGLVHDPATGLAGRDPEAALAGIPETIPLLAELKDRYLAQATGPRQKALLEPLIDHRLDRAGVNLGRIVHQATSVLDDRSVANLIADLQQDASLSWQDTAHLRLLGRTVVNELRYQGERKGWDAGQTDTGVRTGLSDLYAGAVEAAIGQDPERAATLYDHARVVIQPERQAVVERKIERAREERSVTEIVGGLADTPDDPTRRPDLDDYQARAAEATPPDASPELRAQVSRMAAIEHARADREWQAKRGRAATGALDWLGGNPTAPLMAMPTELRDGLSPEQTEALDRTAMNGGRVVTDRDLYDRLDDQSVRDPESFAGVDLTQHRLSLGDSDYNRLTKRQQALRKANLIPPSSAIASAACSWMRDCAPPASIPTGRGPGQRVSNSTRCSVHSNPSKADRRRWRTSAASSVMCCRVEMAIQLSSGSPTSRLKRTAIRKSRRCKDQSNPTPIRKSPLCKSPRRRTYSMGRSPGSSTTTTAARRSRPARLRRRAARPRRPSKRWTTRQPMMARHCLPVIPTLSLSTAAIIHLVAMAVDDFAHQSRKYGRAFSKRTAKRWRDSSRRIPRSLKCLLRATRPLVMMP